MSQPVETCHCCGLPRRDCRCQQDDATSVDNRRTAEAQPCAECGMVGVHDDRCIAGEATPECVCTRCGHPFANSAAYDMHICKPRPGRNDAHPRSVTDDATCCSHGVPKVLLCSVCERTAKPCEGIGCDACSSLRAEIGLERIRSHEAIKHLAAVLDPNLRVTDSYEAHRAAERWLDGTGRPDAQPDALTELRRLAELAPSAPWCSGPLYSDPAQSWIWEGTAHHNGDPEAPDTRFGQLNTGAAELMVAMRNALPVLLRTDEAQPAPAPCTHPKKRRRAIHCEESYLLAHWCTVCGAVKMIGAPWEEPYGDPDARSRESPTQKTSQEPREGRPDKTDVGNGIGQRGEAEQPGVSEVETGVEVAHSQSVATDEAPVSAPNASQSGEKP